VSSGIVGHHFVAVLYCEITHPAHGQ
jgi:hypothetical protein